MELESTETPAEIAGPIITCDVTTPPGLDASGSGPSSGSGFGPDSGLGIDETGYSIGVLERLREQRDMGRFCDATLLVDGVDFHAHRAVLSACSPYFESRLDGTRIARQRLTIVCRPGSHKAFEALLKYMYSGMISIRDDLVADLVRLSDRFSMPHLRDRCIEYLHTHLTPSSCFRIRDLASGLALESFVRIVDAFVVANIKEITEADGSLELPAAQLEVLIGRSMPLSEIERVRFICRWVEQHPDSRRQRLSTLLGAYVQWGRVGAMELCSFLRSSPVLPSDWCLYRVLQSIKDSCLLPDIYFDQLAELRDRFAESAPVQPSPADGIVESDLLVETENVAVEVTENDAEDMEDDDLESGVAVTASLELNFPEHCPTHGSAPLHRTSSGQQQISNDSNNDNLNIETEVKAVKHTRHRQPLRPMPANSAHLTVNEERTAIENGDGISGSNVTKKRKVKRARQANAENDIVSECSTPLQPTLSNARKVVRKRNPRSLRKAKCRQCPFTTFSPEKLRLHALSAHRDRRTFSCNVCEFRSQWNRDFYRHMRGHFPGPPHRCDACPFVTEKLRCLIVHRMDHSDERPFACTTCGVRFKMKNNLLAHERCHSGDKPFQCSSCDRSFATKGTLKHHEVTHSTLRPYLCDLCGFGTKFQSHLIAHRRIHTGDVYKCSVEGCDYSTPKRSQLACHARAIHLHVRSHVCPECNRAFAERSQMTRHARTHLAEKPFACDRCEYRSTRRDKLKAHIEKHHSSNVDARVSPSSGTRAKAGARKLRSKRGATKKSSIRALTAVEETAAMDTLVTTQQPVGRTELTDSIMSTMNCVVGVPVYVSGADLSLGAGAGLQATAGDDTSGAGDGGIMLDGSGGQPTFVNLGQFAGGIGIPMFSPLGLIDPGNAAAGSGPVYLTVLPNVDPSSFAPMAAGSQPPLAHTDHASSLTTAAAGNQQLGGICSSLWLVNDPNDAANSSASCSALDLTSLNSLVQILLD